MLLNSSLLIYFNNNVKDEILSFFHNRIASLGQLFNKKDNSLRKFIETTTLKDEDATETKQFLLLAAQIEKIYITNQCKDLLETTVKRETASAKAFRENMAFSAINSKKEDKEESSKTSNISEDRTK